MATAINGNDIRDLLSTALARKLGKNIDIGNITITVNGEAVELANVVFGVAETTPRKGRKVGYKKPAANTIEEKTETEQNTESAS